MINRHNRHDRKISPVDVLKSLHDAGFVTDDALKKLNAPPIVELATRNEVSEMKPLTLTDLCEWHIGQSRRRDITEDERLFHIKAGTLLTALGTSVDNLSRTLRGE